MSLRAQTEQIPNMRDTVRVLVRWSAMHAMADLVCSCNARIWLSTAHAEDDLMALP